MVRLRFPARLLFTIVMAGCNGSDPAPDAPRSDGSTPDTVAVVDSRADGTAGQDACSIPCGGPYIDAAPGIDAAVCPPYVCDFNDCQDPCQPLV